MNKYSTDQDHNAQSQKSAGDIQAAVNLLELAAALLGEGIEGGAVRVYILPAFNPDHPIYHFTKTYWRNPTTGDRGGAIKLVQRARRCGYGAALAYLEGFIAGREVANV